MMVGRGRHSVHAAFGGSHRRARSDAPYLTWARFHRFTLLWNSNVSMMVGRRVTPCTPRLVAATGAHGVTRPTSGLLWRGAIETRPGRIGFWVDKNERPGVVRSHSPKRLPAWDCEIVDDQ